MYYIDREISDLTRLEQDQIDDYFNKAKEIPLVNNRYHQIEDKAQRILFLQAKDINWEANVWYLDRFQFDETRYDPTRPVRRISFLDIADRKNREYLKIYIKYQLGVTGISVQNIWARTYITKAFLRFLDQEKLAADQLTAAEIDLYMRKLQEEYNKADTIAASLPVCAAKYGDGDLTEFKAIAGRYEAYVSAFMVPWITD